MIFRRLLIIGCTLVSNVAFSQDFLVDATCFITAKIDKEELKLEFVLESENGIELWRKEPLEQTVELGGTPVPTSLIEIKKQWGPSENIKLENGISGRVGLGAIDTPLIVIDRHTGYVKLSEDLKLESIGQRVAKFQLFYGSRGNIAFLQEEVAFGYRLVTQNSSCRLPATLGIRSVSTQTFVDIFLTSRDGRTSCPRANVAFFGGSYAYFNVRQSWQPDIKMIVLDQKQMELSLYERNSQ